MAVEGNRGQELAGRYQLIEQLGEGGMSSVWRAKPLTGGGDVAIKIIDPEIARLDLHMARFLREARTLAALRSPHVVRVLDFGLQADTAFLVMELLQGETLGRRLASQTRLSVRETARILGDVCSAMSVVHEQGLIHRDLKPDNIFLCKADDRTLAKVVDFGIAKSMYELSPGVRTGTGHVLGTPGYMSPEQCRGVKDLDCRTDLWSLGVIVFECLVGEEPFGGDVLADVLLRICMDPPPVPSQCSRVALPAGFDAWFAKAVARDRQERFQSASELTSAFMRLCTATGLGTQAREPAKPAASTTTPATPAPSEASHTAPDTDANTSVGVRVPPPHPWKPKLRTTLLTLAVLAIGVGLWQLVLRRPLRSGTHVEQVTSAPQAASAAPELSVRTGRYWSGAPAPADGAAQALSAPAAALTATGATPSPAPSASVPVPRASPPRPAASLPKARPAAPAASPPRLPRQSPDHDIRRSR